MMDGVDKGAELDAVRQDSPNRSYVGTDAERPLLPHPNTEDVRGKAQANQNRTRRRITWLWVKPCGTGGLWGLR